MKIVDVCEFYAPEGGGVRTYIHAKLAIGARLGHQIIVIAPGNRDEVVEYENGCRIIYVKAPALPFDKKYGMLYWRRPPRGAARGLQEAGKAAHFGRCLCTMTHFRHGHIAGLTELHHAMSSIGNLNGSGAISGACATALISQYARRQVFKRG